MTFEKQGPHNTEAALKLAIEAAREEGIHKIVVASSTGATAKKLAELEHEGIQIIDVGYARGVFGKHEPQMSDEMRQDLEAMGVTVYVASHALSGAERGLSSKLGGFGPVEVAAHALRIIGRGVKVCEEISMMAADAGLVELHEPIVAVAGTGHGADTAVVIRPAPTAEFLDSKVDRIICMPRQG